MEGSTPKRELLIPIRTILVVSATIAVLGAFVEIGSTFLIVFVGIFLGLVFEFPVRFVIKRTGSSSSAHCGNVRESALGATGVSITGKGLTSRGAGRTWEHRDFSEHVECGSVGASPREEAAICPEESAS